MNQPDKISKEEFSDYYNPLVKSYSEEFKAKVSNKQRLTELVFKEAYTLSLKEIEDIADNDVDVYNRSMINRFIGVREIITSRSKDLAFSVLNVWNYVSQSIRVIPPEYTISSIGSQGFLSIPLFKADNSLESFDFIRLHIWDDSLDNYMDLKKCNDFSIHSHTFFARSWVITGKVINDRYEFILDSQKSEHSFFEVEYNKSLNEVNQHTSKAVNKNVNAELLKVSEEIHYANGTYEIKPSKLHRSGHNNSPLCSATFFSFTGKDGLGESFVIGPKVILESEVNRKMNINPIYLLDKIDRQIVK